MQTGIVSLKEDALWPLQCVGHPPTTDGTSADKRRKKFGNLVMWYVVEIVIATLTLEDHIERLDEVFACMKRAGLKRKPSKCEILKDSIKYQGRMVDKDGIRPDPDAV